MPIDIRDIRGGTALHLACLNGSADCVKVLLSKGADVKKQDNYGDNALHCAIDSKARCVVEMLIEARTPNIANQRGNFPIDLINGYEYEDIADLLRKYQDVTDEDSDHSLSSADEVQKAVSFNLPFRFGSRTNNHNFEFNSPLTLDLSKTN